MRELDTIDGVTTLFEHDSKEGKNILKQIQDVEPIIEYNAAARIDKRKDWWFIGTIPDTTVMKWAVECNAKPYSRTWRRYAAKQMNSAEYRKLNPNKIRLDTRE